MQPSKPASPSLSESLYERAKRIMPGGCSRNTVLRKPYPLYAVRGEGCYVTDVEGVRRIDFANNMASLIHGHAHPAVVAAVTEQLHRGTAFTLATEQEITYAEHLCSRNDGFEMIRFVNSGTEAIMGCLKAARAFTGRAKIAKVEGAYHGLYDYAEISQTSKPDNWGNPESPISTPVAYGTPLSTLSDVVVIPFNDIERTLAILNRHGEDEVAAILIDLMPHRVGLVLADPEYIQALRKWADEHGALLIFDEVISLRTGYGGAQDLYDARPDLTAMAKMIGGGFPVGALAGRREVMEVMNPLAEMVLFPHSGTFSANPITMTAGYTAMKLFDRDAVTRLNELTRYAMDKVSEAIKVADVPACVAGAGSMFRVHLKPEPPRDYRAAYATPAESAGINALINHAFDNGVILINTCSATLSTAMTKTEIDHLAEVMLAGFRKIRPQIT
jgi:glutamate-1-semialdehyde 2,1-aminomutase